MTSFGFRVSEVSSEKVRPLAPETRTRTTASSAFPLTRAAPSHPEPAENHHKPMITSTTETYVATETPVALADKPFDRVSWGAIFAGAFTALSIQLVLSLFGIGIGLSTLDPATGDNPSGAAIGIGAVIWWTITSLGSLFLGGFIAGRVAGTFNGYLHGLITWSVVTMATVFLLGSALGGALRGATGLAQFTMQQYPQIRQQAPALAADIDAQARDAANRAQAASNDPGTRAMNEQQARDAGQKAAKGGAMGTIGAAIALVLGAGAAGLGGRTGKRIFLRHAGFVETSDEPARFAR